GRHAGIGGRRGPLPCPGHAAEFHLPGRHFCVEPVLPPGSRRAGDSPVGSSPGQRLGAARYWHGAEPKPAGTADAGSYGGVATAVTQARISAYFLDTFFRTDHHGVRKGLVAKFLKKENKA